MIDDAELEDYVHSAESWLRAHAEPRPPSTALEWGRGSDRVSLFRDSSGEEERLHVDEVRAWQRTKSDAGYGSISWPVAYGGAGLPRRYEEAFRRAEAAFVTPSGADIVSISLEIEAP